MLDKLWIPFTMAIIFKLLSNRQRLRKIKYYSYFLTFYFLSTVVAVVLCPLFFRNMRNVKHCRMGASYCKYITKLYDLKWELQNGEILAEDRGAIIVSNHQSTLDILGMFNIWEIANKLTVVAKKEVLYVFPFGIITWLAGLIFIDRKKKKQAMHQLKKATDVIVKNKVKVWIFPEGTRNKDRSKLLPFKRGAFIMAVHAQVPIIPVILSPYYFIKEDDYVFNRGGHVVIKCLEPVPTKGLTDDDISALIDKIHKIMEDEYLKLSEEVLARVDL